mmetsp:Transcript_22740/g.69541  ORF Transcript_22740/g.69541 Transcript_22740/m.69541 type:complete len:378 (+) Transcript_22740:1151-2284(+)
MSWRCIVKAEGTADGKQRLRSEKANTWPGGESGMTMMIVYGMSAMASVAVRLIVRTSLVVSLPPRNTRASRQTDSTTSPAKIRRPRQQKRSAASAWRSACEPIFWMDHMAEPVTLVIDRSAARSPTCSSSASSSCACAAGVELTNGSTTVPAAVLAAASDGSEGTGVAAAPTASAAAPPSFPASAAASARISARSPMAHQRSTHRSSLSTRTGGVSVPRWKSRVAARSSSRASVSEVISSVTLSSRASACARSLRSGPSASRERVESILANSSKSRLPSLLRSETTKRSSSSLRSRSCGTGVSSVARSTNSSSEIRPSALESSMANISLARSDELVSDPSSSSISISRSCLTMVAWSAAASRFRSSSALGSAGSAPE